MRAEHRRMLQTRAAKEASSEPCETCRFFENDPKTLEYTLKGLTILSSAYGSACRGAGLCSVHDLFLHPRQSCAHHQPLELQLTLH